MTARVVFLVAAVAVLAPRPAEARVQRSLEYEVKSEYLYNFLPFIEWPETAFPRPDAPLRVCILGHDPFRGTLKALVRNERVGAHPVVVDELTDDRTVTTCHVLFVSRLDENRLVPLARTLADHPVLIVGETSRVLELCSAIAFVIDGERVRFDVNMPALTDRGLKASSKLLRVAREVSDRPQHCRD
jgi:hypothetical protein